MADLGFNVVGRSRNELGEVAGHNWGDGVTEEEGYDGYAWWGINVNQIQRKLPHNYLDFKYFQKQEEIDNEEEEVDYFDTLNKGTPNKNLFGSTIVQKK